jgi:hypothetical protein
MLSRVLSGLSLVRVTVGYGVMLVAVATVLLILGPRVEGAVISHMSTNLHNLAGGHFATLLGSVFVTSNGFIYVWLPGLICLLALAELFWRGGRLILAFGLGQPRGDADCRGRVGSGHPGRLGADYGGACHRRRD